MAELIKAPKGTKDIVPSEVYKWHYVEGVLRTIAMQYGFEEIRFPNFEHTELFNRGIGDTTDVVQKEMYTFNDKGGRSVTLRPEGTASTVRAYLENSLYAKGLPFKGYYIVPNYRYENVQKGRLREHHQFGIEVFGAPTPATDAEVISLADTALKRLGINEVKVHINSIGCPNCRPKYHSALTAYLNQHKDSLCEDCLNRLDRNPMRILDCKQEPCKKVAAGAPVALDYLCDDCRAHYEAVKAYLDGAGLAYVEDSKLVRGLDYYTRTVFEVQVTEGMGSQNAIGGGGRYDKLAQEVGGRPTPGFGWALGYERCVLALEAAGRAFPPAARCDFFVACVDDSVRAEAFSLVQAMRDAGFAGEMDHQHRSLKSQFKLADKLDAAQVAVLGPDELAEGKVKVRNMQTHEERLADLAATKALLARLSAEPQGFEPPSIDEVFGA